MYDLLIIGAGQAGLALGAILSKTTINYLLLDKNTKIGHSWRNRWDSLMLFSPAEYDALPGLAFPKERGSYPSKDEMADYLIAYAKHFNLPIQLQTQVNLIKNDTNGFVVQTSKKDYQTKQVVNATGAFSTPFIPSFQKNAHPDLFQIHSIDYKNPDQIPKGKTLLVGTGNTGIQIAQELSQTRDIYLSGPKPRIIPQKILGKDLFWHYYTFGLANASKYSWLGRIMHHYQQRFGEPVIGDYKPLLKSKHVIRVPKTTQINQKQVIFENNSSIEFDNIIWCTGFQNEYPFIQLDVFDKQGKPKQYKGITKIPGFYFLGLDWMTSVNSGQIGGIGKDARYIAKIILARQYNS